jgi:ribonuclease BN (tRNA processing enzyme)
MPQAGRACAGYLLKVGEDLTLIDCGGGVCGSFLRAGFDPLRVRRIIISHTHPDHCCELPLLIQMIYLAGCKERLEIYLPDEFVAPFAAYMRAVYLIKEKLPFEVQITGYGDGFEYKGPFRLKAVGNRHLHGYKELIGKLSLSNRMQCHSFLITAAGKSLLYSADISGLADIESHLVDLEWAVIESTHLDVGDFLRRVTQFSVEQWVLTHLGSPEQVTALKNEIDAARLNNVSIASDGMILSW